MFDHLVVIDDEPNGLRRLAIDNRLLLTRSALLRFMHRTISEIGQAALQDYVIDTLVELVQWKSAWQFQWIDDVFSYDRHAP